MPRRVKQRILIVARNAKEVSTNNDCSHKGVLKHEKIALCEAPTNRFQRMPGKTYDALEGRACGVLDFYHGVPSTARRHHFRLPRS